MAEEISNKRSGHDPRRDKSIVLYDKEYFQSKDNPEGSTGGVAEFYQLVSLLIGVYAFLMKVKWAAWCCLFFFFTSAIHMKLEGRFQQIFTGMGIIIVSFVSTYVNPPPPAPAPPQ